jgi:hypothetical protein
MEALNNLVASLDAFVVACGYVKVSGDGLGSKYRVPGGRGVYTGDVYYLKNCVDFELECMSGSKLVNSAHL